MRSYIVQIDSLNTLNRKLTVEATASARKRAEEAGKLNEELTARVETLSGQVAAGSILRGATSVFMPTTRATGLPTAAVAWCA